MGCQQVPGTIPAHDLCQAAAEVCFLPVSFSCTAFTDTNVLCTVSTRGVRRHNCMTASVTCPLTLHFACADILQGCEVHQRWSHSLPESRAAD